MAVEETTRQMHILLLHQSSIRIEIVFDGTFERRELDFIPVDYSHWNPSRERIARNARLGSGIQGVEPTIV